jgi:hypothetical protein
MAITQPLWNTERLEQYMGSNTYKEFVDFARSVPLFNGKLESVMFGVGRVLYEANLRLNWRLDAVAKRLGRRVSERPLVPERYCQPLGLSALTFHWGFQKVLHRYGQALAQESVLEIENELYQAEGHYQEEST